MATYLNNSSRIPSSLILQTSEILPILKNPTMPIKMIAPKVNTLWRASVHKTALRPP